MIFEELMEIYFSAKHRENRDSAREKYTFHHLRQQFGSRDMETLRRSDVRDYISHRQDSGVKLSTIQRELRLLSAAINFVRAELDLSNIPNPVSRLAISSETPRVRWITREEAFMLLREAERGRSPYLSSFIRLALNTGCRCGELLGLEWSRINWQTGYFLLEAHQNKSRRRRIVHLNADALKALEGLREWQKNRGLATPWVFSHAAGGRIKSLKTSWNAALRRSGIRDFRIHDLRHTFASWLVMQGVSIYVVKELLGHASITQTEIYAHLAPSQAHDAVQQLLPL